MDAKLNEHLISSDDFGGHATEKSTSVHGRESCSFFILIRLVLRALGGMAAMLRPS